MQTEDLTGITLEHWTPDEVRDGMDQGRIVVIDVRTPQEFAFEHIEGVLLAPLATFQPRHLPTQDGKRLVFHCGSGVRSRTVAEACAAAGIGPIAHMAGGFAAWKAAGLPYIGTDPASGGLRRVPGAG